MCIRDRLWHGQRIGRWNGDPAVRPHFAALADTGVQLGGWSLERTGGAYLARLAEPEFGFELALSPTQPLLLQGEAGFSRKGPELAQASHYYSQPQLAVAGRVHVPVSYTHLDVYKRQPGSSVSSRRCWSVGWQRKRPLNKPP